MVHTTFRNLDEVKREKILDAARNEFCNAPLSNARISRIISAAGISRGSFYQYFDTLEDLEKVILEDIRERKKKFFRDSFASAKGDLFEAFTAIFDSEYDFFSDPKNWNLIRHIRETAPLGFPGFQSGCNPAPADQFLDDPEFLDTSRLRQKDPESVIALVELLIVAVTDSIRTGLYTGQTKRTARNSFLKKLEILQKGAETLQ